MSQQKTVRKCPDGSIDYAHYRRIAQRWRYRVVRAYVRRWMRAAARAPGSRKADARNGRMPASPHAQCA